MQFYSSMTLADFVDANWTVMDPNVVRLFEKEIELRAELEEDVNAWRELYGEAIDINEDNRSFILGLINEIKLGEASLDELERFVRDMETK